MLSRKQLLRDRQRRMGRIPQVSPAAISVRLGWVWTCPCSATSAARIEVNKDSPALELPASLTCAKCGRTMNIEWDLSNMPDWMVPPTTRGANVTVAAPQIHARASSTYDSETIENRLDVLAPLIKAGDSKALEERDLLLRALADLEG